MRKGSGRRSAALRVAASVVSALLCTTVLVSCRDTTAAVDDGGRTYRFTVDEVPEGYRLAVAGAGVDDQLWGTDGPSDTPYTVVVVDGRAVTVSLVPWDPMEGRLTDVAAVDHAARSFELDGTPAAFGDGSEGASDALVVEVGPTEALRVSAVDATKDELVDIARHARTTDDRAAAPTLVDVPETWDVIGSVGADALMAARGEVSHPFLGAPGPSGGYGLGWVGTGLQRANSTRSLAVSVLLGDQADLDALAAADAPGSGGARSISRTAVGGRPAVVIDSNDTDRDGPSSLVATKDERGALVIVVATGSRRPDQAQLLAMAGSVRQVDESEWEALRVEAFGGPGLHPDPGETELARGEADGTEWLLQTRSVLPSTGEGYGVDPTSDLASDAGAAQWPIVGIDECLKLSTGDRACTSSSMGVGVWARSSPELAGVDFPEFVLVSSGSGGAQARLEVDGTVTTAPLVPIDGIPLLPGSVGLVFADLPDGSIMSICTPTPPPTPEGISIVRLGILDAAGTEIACAGL